MKTWISSIAVTALCLGGINALAVTNASEASRAPSWEQKDLSVKFFGNLVRKKNRNRTFSGEAIFSDNFAVPGNVAFVCINGVFTSNVAITPANFGDVIDNWHKTRRRRLRMPDVYINDKKIEATQWTFLPQLQLILPREKRISAKLYNAAIRGDKVSVGIHTKDKFDLVLPRPNSAFANFGAACGMGNQKTSEGKL